MSEAGGVGRHSGWLADALGLSSGQSPFPWQSHLLRKFLEGSVPPSLDIPTGLGKTAVMAIWLVARACGAKLPRRLVYVVDRRAVVDQATEVAIALRALVEVDSDLKAKLGLSSGALPISTLRGHYVDNREWLEDPASPAIVVGTVDMVGSRLLFEGYGVSRKMRPYHAGLLGADTLVVLDEAHLVPPFEKLLESIAGGDSEFGPRDPVLRALVPGFRLLSLSATGRTVGSASLGLTAEDLKHPVVEKRLDATKRLFMTRLESTSETSTPTPGRDANDKKMSLADALAREAWNLAQNGARNTRIITYCDSRDVAGKAKSAVEKLAKGDENTGKAIAIDAELFVGGRRVFEREQAKKRLAELGFIAESKVACDRPAFLFATSAAEVGVDLDADHMVCDLVAWERMVQRLGRVNRRGDGDATVVVVVEPEPEPTKREQEAIAKTKRGEEIEEKESRLIEAFEVRARRWKSYQAPFECLPTRAGRFDASPGALRELKLRADADSELRRVLDDATTAAPLRPALTRALVDAWSLTSLEKHTGRPAVDPWLRGWIENDPPQTAVVWRKHLPLRSGPMTPTKREIEAYFEAAPPHASEVLETERFRVFDWIKKRAKAMDDSAKKNADSTMQAPPPGADDVVAFVLSRGGDLRRALRLGDLASTGDAGARKELEEELGGATLVVAARLAGLKAGLLDENENESPRLADDGQEWLGDHEIRFRVRSVGMDESAVADTAWRERLRFAMDVSEEGEPRRWLVVEKWRHDAATEEDRSSARPQLLEEHQSWAERWARRLARRLRLDRQYEEMLAIAARLHDEGKRARRWQRAFNAPGNGPYAKTRGPINYALLDGYRHELGSLPRAECDEQLKRLPDDLRDLALHLIAAHHGFARPVIGTRSCEDAPPSVVEERARDVALRFARLQRRWGPWGLAWWESLLRAADQQASRDNDAAEPALQAEAV